MSVELKFSGVFSELKFRKSCEMTFSGVSSELIVQWNEVKSTYRNIFTQVQILQYSSDKMRRRPSGERERGHK